MAIEWADNFRNYGEGGTGTARLTNGPYAIVGDFISLTDDPDPNISGTVLSHGEVAVSAGSTLSTLRRIFSNTLGTVGVAHRLWMTNLPPTLGNTPTTIFVDALGEALLTIAVLPTGGLRAYRGPPSTSSPVLGSTAGPVLVANAWQHIEIRAVFSSTVGAVEIRVDGIPVLNLTNVNTSASNLPAAGVDFRYNALEVPIASGNITYRKDVVVWNTLGANNISFLGSVGVFTLRPDADVALNWTPTGAANGWSILDNNPPDDASYISAGTGPIPAAYRGTLTNLPPEVTSVRGLVTIVRASKTDGGDGQLQVGVDSGAATANGANRPITAAFTYWSDVFETDPNTSTTWTPAGVNAAGIRINRTV